jgi:phenylpropionate dioxygenase-like ring-hydroxylating dioxygenase large terminal subunit
VAQSGVADQASADANRRSTVMDALEHYWFPVAWSREVTNKPVPVQLLGKRVVVWRSNGVISAFYDLCIHRGTPLSLGWLNDDGQLVCGYHGWHYASDGSVAWIPSLPPGRSIPKKACATTYAAKERYDLVWVCLAEPIGDVPKFPQELDDPSYFEREAADGVWHCNAARFVENMMDTSHFAWVHPGIFGTRTKPIVEDVKITHTETGMTYRCIEPVGNLVDRDQPHIRDYELTFPFQIAFRAYQPHRTEHDVTWYACSPVSSRETKWFVFRLRDFKHPLPPEMILAETMAIGKQDRTVVESQRPEELPLNLREELHLKGPDDVALQYRRALLKLGVDWE